MNELQKCHKLVWDFRKEIEPFWATPDPLNSLRYAFTEAAEAMDAWLRQNRPDDSRNNERQNDVLDELADCAIMLLTALNNHNEPFRTFRNPNGQIHEPHNLDRIAKYTIRCIECEKQSLDYRHQASACIWRIANYPEMNLLERIKSRLARIADKHVPVENIALDLIQKLDL